ncbi:MAG TPA: transporter substrate-binding domain-containing protein [Tianweitania sediminis]|nr:transporter substrate-binding domain-containing protein [Tianweitania sediminis]
MTTALATKSFADTLSDIKAKGKVSIGVKSDSRPWGFLDPQGNPIGMEVDLAKDVAKRLGVELEPVVVQSSNRIQFLEQGRVDLLIATMYDTPERRRVIDMVQPHYYSAATSLLSPKSAGLKEWSEVKGKPVCGQQGSVYNRWIEQTYGAQAMSLPTIEEAYAALRAGNCVGFVYNDLLLKMATDEAQWSDYEVALPSEDRQYHSIGIRKGEAETAFGKAISAIVTEWHKTGKLIELNKEWKIPENEFLKEEHAKAGG